MNVEINQSIDRLLDKESTSAQCKSALKHLGEVLEEDYILNLPPQRPILKALESLSGRVGVEPAIKSKLKKLIKEYGL